MLVIFYNLSVLFLLMWFGLWLSAFDWLLSEYVYILELNISSFSFLVDFKIFFYFDFLSGFFLMVVSLITSMAFYFSKFYMESDKNKLKFLVLTFFFVLSMFLVIMSLNSFIIMLGWDGLGVVSYLLVIHYHSDYSNYSGVVTIMTNRLGDIGMIMLIYFMINLYSMDMVLVNYLEDVFNFVVLMVVLGGFTKSAQFPFSTWLPLAMAAPTPISSLVHSSTLVTAGVYLMIRMNYLFKNNCKLLSLVLFLSLFTMVSAGIMAMFELDIKKIIAFSTLSQLGLMMFIVISGMELLGFFHILSHAMFKSLLFFCSGVMIHGQMDNQDIRYYCGIFKYNYLVSGMFLVSSMSLSGFPFLSGFYSKDLILEMFYMLNFNFLIFVFMVISLVLSGFYSLRVMKYGFFICNNGGKVIFMEKWESIYNSLFLCYMGVLFFGCSYMWLMLEKLDLIFLKSGLKLLNFFLFLATMIFFFTVFESLNKKKKIIYFFFLNFMFLLPFQGLMFNKILNFIGMYNFIFEMVFEKIVSGNNSLFLLKLSKILNLLKFFMFIMSVMFILIMFMVF